MPLPGPLLKRIQQVMLDAFSRDELRSLVRFGLDQDFEALTPDKALTVQVFALIKWAQRNGCLRNLIDCAQKDRPRHHELQALWDELASRPLTDLAKSACPVRSLDGVVERSLGDPPSVWRACPDEAPFCGA